ARPRRQPSLDARPLHSRPAQSVAFRHRRHRRHHVPALHARPLHGPHLSTTDLHHAARLLCHFPLRHGNRSRRTPLPDPHPHQRPPLPRHGNRLACPRRPHHLPRQTPRTLSAPAPLARRNRHRAVRRPPLGIA